MNVDWELFKIQKEYLVTMASDKDRLIEEVDVLDGVIGFMDAYQDANMPLEELK